MHSTTSGHLPAVAAPGDRPAETDLASTTWLRLQEFFWALACTALCAIGFTAQQAHAAQLLEVRDGDTAIVRISVRDQTRLRADRGRILDVIGDVFDAQKNPGGRLVVLKDEADGEFYVKPMPANPYGGAGGMAVSGPLLPVKLDVKTDRGTVGLLLQPADVVGDTLSLRVSGGEWRVAANDAAMRGGTGKSSAHLRSLKALTLAMASPALAPELPVQRLPSGGTEMALWKEARFVLRSRHEAPGLVGETYELTNVSQQRMVIDERELYRPGVLSVGLRLLTLQPGETTPVWIVRQSAERD